MATVVTPPDTAYFNCREVIPLPVPRVPRGCEVNVYADKYLRDWRARSDSGRLYVTSEFNRRVLPLLEPVRITHEFERKSVFVWHPKSERTTWRMLHDNFPEHGVSPSKHQVIPWITLQELVLGWMGHAPVVPKNDRGVLVMLGDAGVTKLGPNGPTGVVGTKKFVVQLNYFASLGPATWVLDVSQNEFRDDTCPADILVLTVQ